MKNIKKIALATALLLITTSALAATGDSASTGSTAPTSTSSASLEMKSAPKLISKTDTSVTLEWDKVAAAATYIVKYSKKSVAQSTEASPQYDNETDPVTSTGTTVSSLEADTTYYFSVVAVDKDNVESDTFSDELSVKTEVTAAKATASGAVATTDATASGAVASFSLTTVTVQDNKTIVLEFSSPLGTTPVGVKIVKTSDNSDVPVNPEAKADPSAPNKAIVKITTVLDPSSSYTLTVLTAADAQGNNIKQGIDGIKEFTTTADLTASVESAPIADPATMSGATASGATLSGATVIAPAPTATDLTKPATGAKENLIVIMALILSLGIVLAVRRKTAK